MIKIKPLREKDYPLGVYRDVILDAPLNTKPLQSQPRHEYVVVGMATYKIDRDRYTYLLLFDVELGMKNFKDNIIFAECTNDSAIFSVELISDNSIIGTLCDVFDKTLGCFISDNKVPDIKNIQLTPDDVIMRATLLSQVLSQFDYKKADEIDKQLLYNLRENAISLLHSFFVGMPQYTRDELIYRKDGYVTEKLRTGRYAKLATTYTMRSRVAAKLFINGEREYYSYVSKFIKTAKNGSLGDVINFCQNESNEIVLKVESKKIEKEIKKRKAEEKQNEKERIKKEKTESKKEERYKL